MKNYLFYYYPKISLIYQYGDEFKYIGLDYFRYFKFKLSLWSPDKTWIPGISIELIILGLGFEACSHMKR